MRKRLSAAQIIALGFASLILLGSGLLMLPGSVKDGVSLRYVDALYTSTSAVCVTGLIVKDTADTFTPLGQFIIGLLIQIGGLGVTAVGAGFVLAAGRRVNLRGRSVLREAMNLDSGAGLFRFLLSFYKVTVIFEQAGAALSIIVFSKYYSLPRAIGVSLFHSVAAFNNAGFDILGGGTNLIPYADCVLLILATCALVIFGGFGFLSLQEIWLKRFKWRKFSMHTKVVVSMTVFLIAFGTILLKLTEDLNWMGALFHSVSARTAGFSTKSLGSFSDAGLTAMMALKFIGASPGSTGGGVKTTTIFVLFKGIVSAATNRSEKAFKSSIPASAFRKATVIVLFGLAIILMGTWLLLVMEPDIGGMDALFEITSAFATVGLSTGITPTLSVGSKLMCIVIMFIGRLGPMTIVTLGHFTKGDLVRYPEGNLSIG